MANPNLRIPEPTLPEHLLIRDAAPAPQLSAGLKARVMSECGASIARAQTIWRWKVVGATTALCCLSLLIALAIPDSSEESPQVSEQPQPGPSHVSHGPSIGYSSGPSLAVDSPKPSSGKDPEKTQTNELIEALDKRKMFDANMLF